MAFLVFFRFVHKKIRLKRSTPTQENTNMAWWIDRPWTEVKDTLFPRLTMPWDDQNHPVRAVETDGP